MVISHRKITKHKCNWYAICMPLLRYSLFNKVTAQKRAFSFNQRTCCRNVAMTFKRTRSVRTSLRTLRVRSPLRALRSDDHRHLRCQALKIMGAMSVLGIGQQVDWKSLRRSDRELTIRHLIVSAGGRIVDWRNRAAEHRRTTCFHHFLHCRLGCCPGR